MLLIFSFFFFFLFLVKAVGCLVRCYNMQIIGASFAKFCLFEHISVFVCYMYLAFFSQLYMDFQGKRISREKGNYQIPFQVTLQWTSYIIMKLLFLLLLFLTLIFVFVFCLDFCISLYFITTNTIRGKKFFSLIFSKFNFLEYL